MGAEEDTEMAEHAVTHRRLSGNPATLVVGTFNEVGYKYGMNLRPCSISGNRKAFLFFKEQVLSNNFEHNGGIVVLNPVKDANDPTCPIWWMTLIAGVALL